jgi:hypothetical protein
MVRANLKSRRYSRDPRIFFAQEVVFGPKCGRGSSHQLLSIFEVILLAWLP